MNYLQKVYFGIMFLSIAFFKTGYSQETEFKEIPLNDLSAFTQAGANWIVASEFSSDYSKPWDLKKIPSGTGILLNDLSKKNRSHLITKEEFGDMDLELDFMMEKGSNSGMYLQGRYEVQLFDSWKNPDPTFADCGGIYQRWNDSLKIQGYEGIAPLTNASHAPGLWQHLRIRFRAPRFDDRGNKTSNARFDEVYLNGILVQQQVEVTGPTQASILNDEKEMGPLVFQGDHGKVAFRNIKYHPLSQLTESNGSSEVGAIVVKPEERPYLLRSFMMFEDKKLDYIISVGNAQGLNYSYDLGEGAWLQVWRGDFIDATEMWHNRGEDQLAQPLGSIVAFTDTPTVAELADADVIWPDSVEFDNLQNQDYTLDKKGVPTFNYTINGIKVSDKISPSTDGTGLSRTLNVENPSGNLYCRVISARKIEALEQGLYRVDGKYYIQMDRSVEPLIRSKGQQQEMLVSLKKSKSTLTYTVIW